MPIGKASIGLNQWLLRGFSIKGAAARQRFFANEKPSTPARRDADVDSLWDAPVPCRATAGNLACYRKTT
jgi:hypothetical protein